MKIPYRVEEVGKRESWHKIVIAGAGRKPALDLILARLTGDWMIKQSKSHTVSIYAVLIAEDEDMMLLRCGFDLSESEYKGKSNWSRYYPLDRRTSGWIIPRSTREPHPMAQ